MGLAEAVHDLEGCASRSAKPESLSMQNKWWRLGDRKLASIKTVGVPLRARATARLAARCALSLTLFRAGNRHSQSLARANERHESGPDGSNRLVRLRTDPPQKKIVDLVPPKTAIVRNYPEDQSASDRSHAGSGVLYRPAICGGGNQGNSCHTPTATPKMVYSATFGAYGLVGVRAGTATLTRTLSAPACWIM